MFLTHHQNTKAPDIALSRKIFFKPLSSDDLRGHKFCGTFKTTRGQPGGFSKVTDFDVSTLKQNVHRFDVQVDNVLGVDVTQSIQNLLSNEAHEVEVKWEFLTKKICCN